MFSGSLLPRAAGWKPSWVPDQPQNGPVYGGSAGEGMPSLVQFTGIPQLGYVEHLNPRQFASSSSNGMNPNGLGRIAHAGVSAAAAAKGLGDELGASGSSYVGSALDSVDPGWGGQWDDFWQGNQPRGRSPYQQAENIRGLRKMLSAAQGNLYSEPPTPLFGRQE